jgi:hypothetical protein
VRLSIFLLEASPVFVRLSSGFCTFIIRFLYVYPSPIPLPEPLYEGVKSLKYVKTKDRRRVARIMPKTKRPLTGKRQGKKKTTAGSGCSDPWSEEVKELDAFIISWEEAG